MTKRFAGLDTSNYLGAIHRQTSANIEKRAKSRRETLETITGPDVTEKNRIFDIRSMRNLTFHPTIEPLCEWLLTAPGREAGGYPCRGSGLVQPQLQEETYHKYMQRNHCRYREVL
ncbi:MAG: hypothetical protein U5L72_16360 [Bacteroidales bacterium]|nr:hypothetical protein [Bacteroidales bacterium]